MRLLKKSGLLFTLALFTQCTLSLVKEEGIKNLDKSHDGVYVCLKDINVGNNDVIEAGKKIRLYFQSGTNSIKVYAYPDTDSREKSIGRNILYLFETDFPETKYDEKILEKKLSELVRKVG